MGTIPRFNNELSRWRKMCVCGWDGVGEGVDIRAETSTLSDHI